MNDLSRSIRPGATTLALLVGAALLAATGCTHLRRDVEYSLIPARPHVYEHPTARIELVDISRHGRDDYMVVRIRVENRSTSKAVFEPKRVALVIGDQVKAAIDEYKPKPGKERAARSSDTDDADSLGLFDSDGDDDDGDGDSSWLKSSRAPDDDPRIEDWQDLKDTAKDTAKGAVVGAAAGIYVAAKVTEYAIKGTYYALKGTLYAVKGAHNLIDNSIHNALRQIGPGESSVLAIRFDKIPAKTDTLPSYLFFEAAMYTDKDVVFPLQPLLVANPQEPHMGFRRPQRARLAAGLRFGLGSAFGSQDNLDVNETIGLHGFLGPRIGRWSFTAVGIVGKSSMLGLDVRRDIVETPKFLSTLYFGYGRHWLQTSTNEYVDGRGLRLGVEFMRGFSSKAYDWHVITSAIGGFLEVTPMTLGDEVGVSVAGGVSWLLF